ncbi:MAG: NUDIX hydrolase [Actinomycetota bacterium]
MSYSPLIQSQTRVSVAIAILYRDGKFLCQLRDDIPGIRYPGLWALFGGHLEPGETPEAALLRELQEEIRYTPSVVSWFGCYPDAEVVRHVFHSPLRVDVKDLSLQEGWDLGLLTPEEIRAGQCYSAKADCVRPLGRPHQGILLDFLAQQEQQSLLTPAN